jgi:hypothetical protein
MRRLEEVRGAVYMALAHWKDTVSLPSDMVNLREQLPTALTGDVILISKVLLELVDEVDKLTGEVAGLKGRIAKFEEERGKECQ